MAFGNWQDGTGKRYEVRVGDVLWYDQGQYHGRAPVEIRDRVTQEVIHRTGDVRIIGNFSPIEVNLAGMKVLLTDLLKFDEPIEVELTKRSQHERLKKRGIERGHPKEWMPPLERKQAPRKGKSMGHSMGATAGAGPYDTDGAAELLSEAQAVLLDLISARFEPGNMAPNDEVVAAAALLHNLTDDFYHPAGEPGPLDLSNPAHAFRTFAMAVAALDRVLEDKAWVESFPQPHRKHSAVRALRNAIEEKAARPDR